MDIKVSEYIEDLVFQLEATCDLDWDYFVETAIRAKIAADLSGENVPETGRTMNDIVSDATDAMKD